MSDTHFQNPILRADYSDPDIIRVGEKYYMIASTFQLCPGMAILESEDLLHWKTVNYAIPNPELLEPQFSWQKMGCYNLGIYAGSLRHLTWKERQPDGTLRERQKWFVYTTIYHRGIVVATADDVYGQWQACFMKDKNGQEILADKWDDNCPYWEFHEDGTLKGAWMIASKTGRHWYTRVFRMSLDGMTLLDADVRFMRDEADATRMRTGETPAEEAFGDIAGGDPVFGEILHRSTGEVIPTSHRLEENHSITMDRNGDIASVLYARHIPGREGTVINDTPSAEASKILRFGPETAVGNTFFRGRHGEREKVSDYVYIFSSEWWDGFRFPVLRRAKSVYGDLWDEDGRYVGPGTAGNPGAYETQRICLNMTEPFDTREPNQGGYVDVPAPMALDGKEHWYFMTHHGNQNVSPDGRPVSLLPVTWVEGWPLFGRLPEGEKRSSGEPTVLALPYDGTGLTADADPTRRHPHAEWIPGIMDWNPPIPPIRGKHTLWRYQDSDNFGDGDFGGMQNSTAERLSPIWQWNHAPRDSHWSLAERPGYLRLYAFPTADQTDDFFQIGNVICQRYISAPTVLAECRLELGGMAPGQEAGLVHCNGGVSHASVGVVMGADGRKVLSYNQAPGQTEIFGEQIVFRSVVGEDRINRFFYSTDNGETFSQVDGEYALCPGNYRGDYIGIYTYNNGDAGFVDVDYFRYEYE